MVSGPGPPRRGALDGVRILELGHGVTGPYTARLLGDLGADVVKVEPPDGEMGRRLAPLVPDARTGEPTSALFTYLNWNKRSIVVDLRDPGAADLLAPLVAASDIVIESFRPGRLHEWGLGFDVLREWNDRIALVSVTNFGQTGPSAQDRATDLIFYARSGLSSISGFKDPQHPLKHGLRQGLYGAAMAAAYAALAGRRLANQIAEAVHVDFSIHECLTSEMVTPCAYYSFAGAVQGRNPSSPDPLEGLPLKTASGYVSFQVNERAPVSALAELLGNEMVADPRNIEADHRVRSATLLKASVERSLSTRPALDWFVDACERGLLAGVVQGAAELLSCPHLRAREVFRSVPRGGRFEFPVELARYSRTPVTVRLPAPDLNEHETEIRASLGETAPRFGVPTGHADGPLLGPLAGVRVVELASLVSAPYVGALLADLGAEVIKIEGPQRVDPLRYSFGPLLDNELGDEPWNRAGAYHVLNRGKKSFVCDLQTAEGRALLRELLVTTDVLIENFSPGVLPKWGLTPDVLDRINPGLICLSNSGFGGIGPWRSFKAQGTTLENTMGPAAYTGYENGPPLKAGQSYPDFLACWSGTLAVLAALTHRDATGEGQHIDQGMYQMGPSVIPEALLHHQHDGHDCGRHGAQDLDAFVSGVYRSDDESWVAVSLADADEAAALHGRLQDGTAVPPDSAAVEGWLAEWIGRHASRDVVAALREAGVAVGRVNNTRDLFLDEHLRARGFFEEVDNEDPDIGPRSLIGRPFSFVGHETAARVRHRAPRFGEHNDEVLRDILGLDDGAIAALAERGTIGQRPTRPLPLAPIDFEVRISKGQFDSVDPDYRNICARGSARR